MESIDRLDVERVPIDSVSEHPRNARQGDLDVIADSLQVHGQFAPIIVQRSTRLIVKGNHTHRAARMLGWDRIDVAFIDVDDDQALRILLVDNRSADLGGYVEQSLTDLLAGLNDLIGTGYEAGDLDARLASLDAPTDFASWGDKDARSILLSYPAADHAALCDVLDVLAGRLGVDSYSEVVDVLATREVERATAV